MEVHPLNIFLNTQDRVKNAESQIPNLKFSSSNPLVYITWNINIKVGHWDETEHAPQTWKGNLVGSNKRVFNVWFLYILLSESSHAFHTPHTHTRALLRSVCNRPRHGTLFFHCSTRALAHTLLFLCLQTQLTSMTSPLHQSFSTSNRNHVSKQNKKNNLVYYTFSCSLPASLTSHF